MIKLLKSGTWALEGRDVVELTEGDVVDFGPSNNVALVNAEWAKWNKKTEDEDLAEQRAEDADLKADGVDPQAEAPKTTKKAK